MHATNVIRKKNMLRAKMALNLVTVEPTYGQLRCSVDMKSHQTNQNLANIFKRKQLMSVAAFMLTQMEKLY